LQMLLQTDYPYWKSHPTFFFRAHSAARLAGRVPHPFFLE
jgi:hypothetical protein